MGVPKTKAAQHAILAVMGLSLGAACFFLYALPTAWGFAWLAGNGYLLPSPAWVEPYGLRVFLRLLLVLGLPVAATAATVAGLRLCLRRALARQGGGGAAA